MTITMTMKVTQFWLPSLSSSRHSISQDPSRGDGNNFNFTLGACNGLFSHYNIFFYISSLQCKTKMTILIKYVLYCTSLNSLNRSCPLYNMTSDEMDGWRLDLTFNCLQSCSLAPDHRSLYAERDTAVRSRGRCAGYWGRGMMTPAPLTVSAHPPPRPEQTCRRCQKPLI